MSTVTNGKGSKIRKSSELKKYEAGWSRIWDKQKGKDKEKRG